MAKKSAMLQDVQEVVAGHLFTGLLHTSTVLAVPAVHPGGMWRTVCNVPLDLATLAKVSRKFREGCRAWRKREMEKMVSVVLHHALDRAFDMCQRDCYPYYGGPPLMTNMQHVLCLQAHQVVAVKFRRTGKKRAHELDAWMEVEDWNGLTFYTDTWTTLTPRFGWKMLSKMRGREIDKWQKWMRCERRAMHWWFCDKAAKLMDPSSAGDGLPANTDLPATMWSDADMWPDGHVVVPHSVVFVQGK